MPALHQYRTFISHAWTYGESYNRLIQLLNAAPSFSYANYSVPRSKRFNDMSVTALKEELRDQIRPVGCLLVSAGMYVAHSGWIQFEMDFAKLLGKPIIGVAPWGSARVPQAVQDAAVEMVGWNQSTIVRAIRRHGN